MLQGIKMRDEEISARNLSVMDYLHQKILSIFVKDESGLRKITFDEYWKRLAGYIKPRKTKADVNAGLETSGVFDMIRARQKAIDNGQRRSQDTD